MIWRGKNSSAFWLAATAADPAATESITLAFAIVLAGRAAFESAAGRGAFLFVPATFFGAMMVA